MNELGGLRSVEDSRKTEEVWTVNGRDCLYVVVYPFLSGCSMDFLSFVWKDVNYYGEK